MQPDFWKERWRIGRIGFHRPAVDESLQRYWHRLELPKAARVFVPLCGKSLDLLWLRDLGHAVVGAELSDIAIESFCLENGVPARRRPLAGGDYYESPNLDLYRGDLFVMPPQKLRDISAVYDRAALVSWAPELRAEYVAHLTRLTQPGTETFLTTLEYPQDQFEGPPFSIDSVEVGRLYSPHHDIRELARRDVLANEPRIRSRGVNQLDEVCYRITRV